jgi:hypothetical protein
MRTRPLRAAAAALLIAACASNPPALESTLRFWDLGARGADAIGSWRSQLVSGAGTDWTRKAVCRPDGACTFFGSTRGSFGPSTDFLAMGEIPDQRFQWARTYGGPETDELDGAAAASDGGYLLFGTGASRFGATEPGALPWWRQGRFSSASTQWGRPSGCEPSTPVASSGSTTASPRETA